MRAVITPFLLLLTQLALSQPFRLSGSFTDSLFSKPLQGVTVSIFKAGDTKAINKVFSDSLGKFNLQVVNTGSYFIQAEAIDFITYTSKAIVVDGSQDKIQLPIWILNNNAGVLKEVTVTGTRRLISNTDDKIIYNVQDDKSLIGLSALEALSRVPFVSVDGLGNVQLKGQSNFRILLNGRPTSLFASNPGEALKAFPSASISKIEVITTPSAKQEGEGLSGLINIVTNNKTAGFNGSSSFTYSNIEKGSINPNNRLSFRNGKLGLNSFVYYAENFGFQTTGFNEYNSLRGGTTFSKRKSLDTLANKGHQFGANIELAYDIDSLQAISIYAVFSDRGGNRNQVNRFTSTDQAGSVQQRSNFFTFDNDRNPGSEIGFDFIKKFIQPGKEFSLSINKQLRKTNTELSSSQYNDPGTTLFLENRNTARNEQITVQVDYVLPSVAKSTCEMGLNFIHREVNSDFNSLFKLNMNDPFLPDNANTDILSYIQSVYGGYLVYSYKYKNMTLKIGSRLERTLVDGNFITSQTTVKQNYYSLLPSALVNWRLKGNHRLNLSYNRRLSRPGLLFMNPFIDNRDPLFLNYGNPLLKPEFSNNIEAGFSGYKNKVSYNISLSVSLIDDGIQRYFIFDENTGITRQTYGNLGLSRLYGLSGFISYRPNDKFSYSFNYNLNYAYLKNQMNSNEKNTGMYGSLSHAVSYTISANWLLFHTISYVGAPLQLQGRNGNFLYYNIGISHFFMKKKLVLSLGASNIFNNTWPIDNHFESATFTQSARIDRPIRSLSVTLRYNYGKLKQSVSRKKGVVIDDTKENINN